MIDLPWINRKSGWDPINNHRQTGSVRLSGGEITQHAAYPNLLYFARLVAGNCSWSRPKRSKKEHVKTRAVQPITSKRDTELSNRDREDLFHSGFSARQIALVMFGLNAKIRLS